MTTEEMLAFIRQGQNNVLNTIRNHIARIGKESMSQSQRDKIEALQYILECWEGK